MTFEPVIPQALREEMARLREQTQAKVNRPRSKGAGPGATASGAIFCTTCHQLVAFVERGDKGGFKVTQNGKVLFDMRQITCTGNTFVVQCPVGHKVVIQ